MKGKAQRPAAGARAPSTADIGAGAKAREYAALLAHKLHEFRAPTDFASLFADLAEYDELLARYSARRLRDARVLEIGYGARPYRAMALAAARIDVWGVDAEAPILDGSVAEFAAILRANGAERLIKSVLRHVLFDRHERRALRGALRRRGHLGSLDPSRLAVADAARYRRPPGTLELIVSEDVFEHIPETSLRRLIPAMRSWLVPDGLALIRPNVFTGITGGHLVEWYRRSLMGPGARRPAHRRSEPWEHLRAGRFAANTHLNRLTRARYRELFAEEFEILEERVKHPRLGGEYLTAEVAAELRDWGKEELFSNLVLFVLRPRARAGGPAQAARRGRPAQWRRRGGLSSAGAGRDAPAGAGSPPGPAPS